MNGQALFLTTPISCRSCHLDILNCFRFLMILSTLMGPSPGVRMRISRGAEFMSTGNVSKFSNAIEIFGSMSSGRNPPLSKAFVISSSEYRYMRFSQSIWYSRFVLCIGVAGCSSSGVYLTGLNGE